MILLPSLTQAQQDAILLDNLILQTAEALHHLAATMARCNSEFWHLPDSRLEAVLNANPARTSAVFGVNSSLASAINPLLDTLAIPAFPARAPVAPGREVEVSESGAYRVVPLPLPADPVPVSVPSSMLSEKSTLQ